jgi:hypothetical protein
MLNSFTDGGDNMWRKLCIVQLLLLIITMVIFTGCTSKSINNNNSNNSKNNDINNSDDSKNINDSNDSNDNNENDNKDNKNNNIIAYISSYTNSEYEKTFKELNLGILFDFNLKLTKADKSWVNLWVEGYSEGKALEPFHLTELSYGLSPNKTEEGRTGFGIMGPNSDEPQIFLYSTGIGQQPVVVNNFFKKTAGSSWNYAIDSEAIGLELGEEKILAVYRQEDDNTMRAGYDYEDQASIDEMIKENKRVLILKIKVEEKSELP